MMAAWFLTFNLQQRNNTGNAIIYLINSKYLGYVVNAGDALSEQWLLKMWIYVLTQRTAMIAGLMP